MSDCDEYWYAEAHPDECVDWEKEDREKKKKAKEKEWEEGLTESERRMFGINVIDADPITKVTKNPMFPLVLLGGLALAGYWLFFKKGKKLF